MVFGPPWLFPLEAMGSGTEVSTRAGTGTTSSAEATGVGAALLEEALEEAAVAAALGAGTGVAFTAGEALAFAAGAGVALDAGRSRGA